ncbi:MAG: zinc-binding dehydrogenase [Planctomycetota bacterium]
MILPQKGKIIRCVGKNQIELTSLPVEKLRERQILIRTHLSLVSSGTELWDITRDKSAQEYPHKIGYCTVGTVEQVGPEVRQFAVGDRVFCTIGHREYGIVDVEASSPQSATKTWPIVKIPKDIAFEDAVYLILISVAFYAVTDGRTGLGDSLLNYGLGIVGNFVSQMAVSGGALPVVSLEPSPRRRQIAQGVGIPNVFDPSDDSTKGQLERMTDNRGFDVVIDSTGVKGVIYEAIQNAADFGRVVICGGMRENVLLDLDPIQRKNISLIGSRMPYTLQEGPRRDFVDVRRTIEKIFAYIKEGKIKASSLTTHVVTPQDAISLYYEIRENCDCGLGIAIDWTTKNGANKWIS